MKKKTIIFTIVFAAAVTAAAIIYGACRNSEVRINTRDLENKLIHNAEEEGQVKNLIHFNYEQVYVFEPYEPKESMEAQIGFKCSILKETVAEQMMNILFVNNHEAAAYLYGYASNTGYYIDLPAGTYTKSELEKLNYTVTRSKTGGEEESIQTYMKYLFTK